LRRLIPFLLCFALIVPAWPQARKKKKSDPEYTESLPVLADPPSAITAETRRLSFHVSPLSAKGLLSAQTRDAIKSLMRQNGGAQIVKLRAFVAGTGDLRRVQTIVSEVFAEKKLPLPVLTTVQVGMLPLEGAQVVIESTAVEKRIVSPEGLAVVSGVAADSVEASIARLSKMAGGLTVLRTTCLLSSLDDNQKVVTGIRSAFPTAESAIVQRRRLPGTPVCECEAVAKLNSPAEAAVEFVTPEESAKSPAYTQVVRVSANRVVLTGLQMGFRETEADVRLAFERIGRALESQKATFADVVMLSNYPLSRAIVDSMRAVRFSYLNPKAPPASTLVLFEGLPSVDASFGMDVIAALRN
jgi:enamine deaminase RidA (YjgF/YER057c/UK114 family)